MGFVRVQKSNAYYSRFQVKYRRRREAKTDYQQRKALITQDKNKYNTPKYRVVVRFTNKDIICQLFQSELTKDVCLAAAYAHELRRYGVACGLTNYAAAYATGLLLARRVNTKFNLAALYPGNMRLDGKEYHVEVPKGKDGKPEAGVTKPFKALLDVGLARTTTGARVFGALKGAVDGGLDVPHNTRRFPGSFRDPDTKKFVYEPEEHRRYIFAQHVADYMRYLKAELGEELYEKQFSQYTKNGVGADNIAALYARAHREIRRDPLKKRDATELGNSKTRAAGQKPFDKSQKPKNYGASKLALSQKRNRIVQLLQNQNKAPVVRHELKTKTKY